MSMVFVLSVQKPMFGARTKKEKVIAGMIIVVDTILAFSETTKLARRRVRHF